METARPYLRELQPSDIDDLFEVLGDAETMRFYPHPKTRQQTAGWIEWSRAAYAENGSFTAVGWTA